MQQLNPQAMCFSHLKQNFKLKLSEKTPFFFVYWIKNKN